MRKQVLLVAFVLAFGFVAAACSNTVSVEDLELDSDLKSLGETETGQPVTEVDCPEEVNAEEGYEFSCDLTLEDGSTITANLVMKEGDDGKFQANLDSIDS